MLRNGVGWAIQLLRRIVTFEAFRTKPHSNKWDLLYNLRQIVNKSLNNSKITKLKGDKL